MSRFTLSSDAVLGIAPLALITSSAAELLAGEFARELHISFSFMRDVRRLVLASTSLTLSIGERESLSDAIIGLQYLKVGFTAENPGLFTDDLIAAVRACPKNPLTEEQINSLAVNASILVDPLPLRASVKAHTLRTEFDSLYAGVQIFTDIRPVFDDDLRKPLVASLISHTIKISTHSDGRTGSMFIVADSEDLLNLQINISRALDKVAALTSLIEGQANRLGTVLDRDDSE